MTDIVERLRNVFPIGWEGEMRHKAADEIERLRSEVASLRLTLGGRTFSAIIPEPIGCPLPGACAQVVEIRRLRSFGMRTIQYENKCDETGVACREFERCGCWREMQARVAEGGTP